MSQLGAKATAARDVAAQLEGWARLMDPASLDYDADFKPSLAAIINAREAAHHAVQERMALVSALQDALMVVQSSAAADPSWVRAAMVRDSVARLLDRVG